MGRHPILYRPRPNSGLSLLQRSVIVSGCVSMQSVLARQVPGKILADPLLHNGMVGQLWHLLMRAGVGRLGIFVIWYEQFLPFKNSVRTLQLIFVQYVYSSQRFRSCSVFSAMRSSVSFFRTV